MTLGGTNLIVLAFTFLSAAIPSIYFYLRSASVTQLHSQVLKQLQKEKKRLSLAPFFSKDSALPNYDYIKSKLTNISVDDDAYFNVFAVCVGGCAEYYEHLNIATQTEIKKRIHSQLSSELSPYLMGLLEDKYHILVFSQAEPWTQQQQSAQKERVEMALPQSIDVKESGRVLDYSLTSITFSNKQFSQKDQGLLRRLKFGLKQAQRTTTHYYPHEESAYQDHLTLRKVTESLKNGLSVMHPAFSWNGQPVKSGLNQSNVVLWSMDWKWPALPSYSNASIREIVSKTPRLNYKLTMEMLKSLSREGAEIKEACLSLPISINDLSFDAFYDDFSSITQEMRGLGVSLVLLLSIPIGTVITANVTEMMNQLRALGVEFATEVLGDGYGNLSELCKLPFSYFKVSGDYISKSVKDSVSYEVMRFLIRTCEQQNMTLWVTDVETASELKVLPAKGCLIVQGTQLGRVSGLRSLPIFR
ncbi:EAL domain-containing protein [Vibrio ostreicida]|uniref:EAL domain-containing protein n=1 Tax=Vibrio ostreicida TaxID=526588 RepID=UPI000970711F|nr:EAL domain-containing protein [Vibrio ostreicida]